MKKQAKLLLAAACGAILVTGPSAASHQWGNYHWSRASNPLKLTINRQLTSNWVGHFDVAAGDWNKSTVLSLTWDASEGGNAGVNSRKCPAIFGAVLVCNDSYGFRGWLGIATIWANGDHITQGTTQLNDSYFNTSTYNTSAWRQLVVCQEIGHDFGLDHQDEDFNNANLGTCMDYTNDPSSNQHPNTHDYAELTDIYQHLDGSTGGGGGGGCNPKSPKCNNGDDAFTFRELGKPRMAPSGGETSDTAGLSPAEWGRAIAYDASGRPDTFQMEAGNGRKKITHVFWTPGFRPPGSR